MAGAVIGAGAPGPTGPTGPTGGAPPVDWPPARFHVMAKPTGAICNLDCEYCFYLDRSERYPDGRFRMSDRVLETYLTQLVEATPGPDLTVAWQGGEPTLMGLDFFRRAVEVLGRIAPRRRIEHTIQTNATLLDEEWAAFFAEHGFLVGVSLDGPPELHDRYRVDKFGRPTAERVVDGLRLLQRASVDVNVLCTVHAANAHAPLEVYRYLRDDLGVDFLQLIPIVEVDATSTTGVSSRTVDAGAWGEFLVVVFDEWVRRDVGDVVVINFEAALARWAGIRGGPCIFEERCGAAVVVEHNGDVYSCDHFVDDAHLLGNVMVEHLVELVAKPQQWRFGAAKETGLPRYCRECPVRFACNGECPKNRIAVTPDGEPGLNHLCAGYRRFFLHVDAPMRAMVDLLRQGRHPAEIRDRSDVA